MSEKQQHPVTDTEIPGASAAADETRRMLVETALDLFGAKGFAGASIREIANAAKANIASIGYHFSGKEGLRRACAEYAASFISAIARTGFGHMPPSAAGLPPQEARRHLTEFVGTVARTLLTSPGAHRIVRFMLREITDESPVLPIIYKSVIEPTHKRVCALWAAATGEAAEDEKVKLAVFAIMGQALYFRIGEAIVTRRMGWDGYDENAARQIAAEIVANLESALDRHGVSPDADVEISGGGQ